MTENINITQYNNEITITEEVNQVILGTEGYQGPQGIQGFGYAQLQGTQGLLGPQGIQGMQGTQGAQGSQGTQGTQGAQGVQGTQGTQGAQGGQGNYGIQGTQGVQGAQGSQGTQGTQGKQGAQGSIGNTGSQGIVGSIGPTGASGINWRNVWSNSTTYNHNDAVYYDSSSWFASGNPPIGEIPSLSSTFWYPLAIHGATGATGMTGAQGQKGDKGDQGIQGLIGIQGIYGAQGIYGSQGTQGIQGAQGVQGSIGYSGVGTADVISVNNIDGSYDTNSKTFTALVAEEKYVDGIQLTPGKIVILKAQSDSTQNGSYVVSSEGGVVSVTSSYAATVSLTPVYCSGYPGTQQFGCGSCQWPTCITWANGQLSPYYGDFYGYQTTYSCPNGGTSDGNGNCITTTTSYLTLTRNNNFVGGTLIGVGQGNVYSSTTWASSPNGQVFNQIVGLQGLQGTAGYVGRDGTQGVQGTQGIAGYAGSDGAQGIQGIQGAKGYTNIHSVVVASTSDIGANTYDVNTKSITMSAPGALIVDGRTLQLNDRVLIKDQTDQTENGIFTVTTVGATASYAATQTTAYHIEYYLHYNGGTFYPGNAQTVDPNFGDNYAGWYPNPNMIYYSGYGWGPAPQITTYSCPLGGTSDGNGNCLTTSIDSVLTRVADYNEISKIVGSQVIVQQGSVNGGSIWLNKNLITDTLDNSSIIFSLSGAQGISGYNGVQGVQGIQGIQGVQGFDGTQGLQGNQGTTGIQGFTGFQGTQGIQGTQGTQGNYGTQGTQGVQGITGLAGTQNAHGAVNAISTNSGAGFSTYFAGTADSENGTGVGAYIEAIANGALGQIDGVTLSVGSRVLFTARANSIENGIYSVTSLGGVSSKYRFTRATDSNNHLPGQVENGDYTFCVTGAVYAGTTWVEYGVGSNSDGTIIIGTDPILFTQASGVGAQGTTGPQGIQGVQGTVGIQGTTGQTGAQGVQGVQGLTGSGTQGVQGPQGPAGSGGGGSTTPTYINSDTTTSLTLTSSSATSYLIDGTTINTFTITLPDTSTISVGQTYIFDLANTGPYSGLSVLTSTSASISVNAVLPFKIICVSTSVNTAAAWRVQYTGMSSVTGGGGANVVIASGTTVGGISNLNSTTATAGGNIWQTAASGVYTISGGTTFAGTLSIASGPLTSGTKTINIGNSGGPTSTTSIFIGSANASSSVTTGTSIKLQGGVFYNYKTVSTSTYIVLGSDYSIMFSAASTITLPTATIGRTLILRTTAAGAIISASSNIIPLVGGSASTAILAATAGKYCMLQADGTNWQIMMAN